MRVAAAWSSVVLGLALLAGLVPGSVTPAIASDPAVTFVTPDDGEILDGTVRIRANVSGATASGVEFFYRAHESATPVSLGDASFDSSSGLWVLDWDTRTVEDTFNMIDTDGDGEADTKVNITKPPTHDELSVEADIGAPDPLTNAIDVRIQNMLTVRFTLPDNQEDLKGFEDLEVLLTGEHEVTSVRFDVYDIGAATVENPGCADPRMFVPFGETLPDADPGRQFQPIENPHYGRPLGAPLFPSCAEPEHEIGAARPEGSKRWVYRGWDTTTIPDGTWLLVASATDSEGRTATYMVESYIVNDLRVMITAPRDGATVSRFVALEARTSSVTGADNALAGGLWPATAVEFEIDGTVIDATEIPSGSGRWRAVWTATPSHPASTRSRPRPRTRTPTAPRSRSTPLT